MAEPCYGCRGSGVQLWPQPSVYKPCLLCQVPRADLTQAQERIVLFERLEEWAMATVDYLKEHHPSAYESAAVAGLRGSLVKISQLEALKGEGGQ